MRLLVPILLLVASSIPASLQQACSPRVFGDSTKIACVCNSTYCDTVEDVGTIQPRTAVVYQSSEGGYRLKRSVVQAGTTQSVNILLDTTTKYQTILGFGGAFTDSMGINLVKLPQKQQDDIIAGYFGQSGLQYTIGRVPMASADFSTHEYSYDDVVDDLALVNFNLTNEDAQYKIPYIKQAQTLSGNTLKLFSSPWGPPAWMKTNNDMSHGGTIKGDMGGDYWKSFANYFIRFFEEYSKVGINFWGMTIENEPNEGKDPTYRWQSLYLSPEQERDFLKTLLGPAMKASPVAKDIKVMIMDDNRENLVTYPPVNFTKFAYVSFDARSGRTVIIYSHTLRSKWNQATKEARNQLVPFRILSDPDAAAFVSGIAVHWYSDEFEPASLLLQTHNNYPDYFMLSTEACTGYKADELKPILGDWSRGAAYAHDIIEDLQNFVVGWTDWNMVLDMQGGPNWVNNTVDAPVIVNGDAQEYYKQPMWYTLGHFSRFVRPDAVRIKNTAFGQPSKMQVVAFLSPEGRRVTVIHNEDTKAYDVSVTDAADRTTAFTVHMDPHSIATIIF